MVVGVQVLRHHWSDHYLIFIYWVLRIRQIMICNIKNLRLLQRTTAIMLVMTIVRMMMIAKTLSKIKAFLMALYDLDQTIILTLFCLAGINIIVQYSANDKMLN